MDDEIRSIQQDATDEVKRGHGVLQNILKTLGILVAAVLVSELLYELLYELDVGAQNVVLVYLLAIFFSSAVTDGYIYGIISAVIGVFAYDFFITEPRMVFSFTVGFPVTVLIMLLVSLVTSGITADIKTKKEIAEHKERRVELLYEMNRNLLGSRDVAGISTYATEFLAGQLRRSVALFVKDPAVSPAEPFFVHVQGDVYLSAFEHSGALGMVHTAFAERAEQACAEDASGKGALHCLPILSEEDTLGVIVVSCKNGPLDARSVAAVKLLAGQLALALKVQQLSERQHTTEVAVEAEKARSSFLRAISHDLRTPLTSVLGASKLLMDKGSELDDETRQKLIRDIHGDSEWLMRMMENILSITRIQEGQVAVQKSMEAAEEVMGEAAATVRKRFPGASVKVEAPSELLLVPMDPILISQVLTNLLRNALTHARILQPKVCIRVEKSENDAVFTVEDNGKGLDADVLAHLFEIQSVDPGGSEDSSRGLGMGLSICRAIVDAHGGAICGENRPEGGARFCFTLPLAEKASAAISAKEDS